MEKAQSEIVSRKVVQKLLAFGGKMMSDRRRRFCSSGIGISHECCRYLGGTLSLAVRERERPSFGWKQISFKGLHFPPFEEKKL